MISTTWGHGKDKKGRPISEISDPVHSFIMTGNQWNQSSTCYTKISRRTIQIQGDLQDFQTPWDTSLSLSTRRERPAAPITAMGDISLVFTVLWVFWKNRQWHQQRGKLFPFDGATEEYFQAWQYLCCSPSNHQHQTAKANHADGMLGALKWFTGASEWVVS